MMVSIIIPVYNVSSYIERCLLSVIKQTYTNLECILVDDCGTDDSVEKCENFISRYEGNIVFKIYHHNHNRGLSAARNTGTEHATGDYIFYLDSDDELPENAIELLVEETIVHSDVEMVQGYTVSVPSLDRYDSTWLKDQQYLTDNAKIRYNYYRTDRTMPVNAWNKLLKTSFIKNNNLIFKEGLIHEDEHWMWFLVKYLQSMSFVFTPTYIHYVTENSIMTSLTEEKDAKHWGEILNDWILSCDDISWKDQLRKILFIYRRYNVNKYNIMNENFFIRRLLKEFWKRKQYVSVMYLTFWYSMKSLRDSAKIYRKISHNIAR